MPVKQNAIYELSAALLKIRDLQFPVSLNDVTWSYFQRTAEISTGQQAADRKAVTKTPPDPAAASRLSAQPFENALLHTTCVATMLSGGHADNALPQTAEASVNCRLLPNEQQANVERVIRNAVGSQIDVKVKNPLRPNPPSPVPPAILNRVQAVAQAAWPGIVVTPVMETGGTDGKAIRSAGMPTYGMGFTFNDLEDIRAHGKDERIRTTNFYEGLDFGYRLIKEFAKAI